MKKEFFKRIWNDPVGAGVISSLILSVLPPIGALLNTIIGGNSYKESIVFILTYPIDVWILFSMAILYVLLKGIYCRWIKTDFRYDADSLLHDKNLYDKIVKEVLPPEGSIAFLRTNNFAGFSFDLKNLEQIDNFFFRFKDNSTLEFINPDIEKLKKNLYVSIDIFQDLIAGYTFPIGNNRQIVPEEWEIECPDHFYDVVDKIQNSTKNICRDYDTLVRIGRIKIK